MWTGCEPAARDFKRFASGAPSRRLLRLLARIVLRVDVSDAPRAGAVELDDRLVVGEGKVRRAGRKRDETAGGQRLGLALVGGLAHAQAEHARDDGYDLGLRMRMGRYAVAFGQFEAEREQSVLAWVAVQRRGLCAGRNRGRRGSPLDLLRRNDCVAIPRLRLGCCRCREASDGQRSGCEGYAVRSHGRASSRDVRIRTKCDLGICVYVVSEQPAANNRRSACEGPAGAAGRRAALFGSICKTVSLTRARPYKLPVDPTWGCRASIAGGLDGNPRNPGARRPDCARGPQGTYAAGPRPSAQGAG